VADTNDQGAFDAGTNLFTAPAPGTYIFGATLLYKAGASTTVRMRGRLALNGTTEIRGLMGEISGGHVTLATALWLQTMVPLMAGDTVDCRDTSAPRAATLPPFTRSSVAARSGIGGRM